MAVKNYLVSAIYNHPTTQWAWKDRAHEGNLKYNYKDMYDISVASFEKFLEGDFTVICFGGYAENPTFNAVNNWRLIQDLWNSHECNILWHGPDTQMIQPTEIFGKYKDFEMFNYTDPKSTEGVEHYFNNDIRYLPSTMSKSVWKIGNDLAKSWDTSNTVEGWGYEQVMTNKMFWSQGYTIEEAHRPTMAYQAQWLPGDEKTKQHQDEWNGCKLEDSHIIHWHGSRDSNAKLAMMKKFAQLTGVID
jgi:hypothetical protein